MLYTLSQVQTALNCLKKTRKRDCDEFLYELFYTWKSVNILCDNYDGAVVAIIATMAYCISSFSVQNICNRILAQFGCLNYIDH